MPDSVIAMSTTLVPRVHEPIKDENFNRNVRMAVAELFDDRTAAISSPLTGGAEMVIPLVATKAPPPSPAVGFIQVCQHPPVRLPLAFACVHINFRVRCSVQVLNPHTASRKLRARLRRLADRFRRPGLRPARLPSSTAVQILSCVYAIHCPAPGKRHLSAITAGSTMAGHKTISGKVAVEGLTDI